MSRNRRACALALAALWGLGTWGAAPAVAQTPAGRPTLPIDVTGATFAEFDDTTGIARMEGAPLVITRGRTVIRAARARFDRRANVLTAEGAVEAAEEGLTIRADAVEYRLGDETIRAAGAVRMTRAGQGGATPEPPTTLAAPEVSGSLRTRRFVATGGVTIARGEWTVRGRRVDYDDEGKTAVVNGDPEVRFADGVMTADTLTMALDAETMRAEGAVQLRRGDMTGRARRADISLKSQLAVFTGEARVDRGGSRLTADVIEATLDGERVTARGASQIVITSPPPSTPP
jgi:lipopolysaccharide assembly outer membrane protein LptD (OstA)